MGVYELRRTRYKLTTNPKRCEERMISYWAEEREERVNVANRDGLSDTEAEMGIGRDGEEAGIGSRWIRELR